MKRLRDHPSAQLELAAARDWYERAEAGLGMELVLEVDRVLRSVADGSLPTLPHPEVAAARRVMVQRFPYWVIVQDRGDEVVLVAVAHMKRRPGYWRARLVKPSG